MISYVECLSGEGVGAGVTSHCWNRRPDEELDELLPGKMAILQPKMEGSLRRRLLSAKIHQQQNAMLGLNTSGTNRPGSPSGDRKPHVQCPGNVPWQLPPHPNVHPSLAPEAHGKFLLIPEVHGKPQKQFPSLQVQRPSCSVLTHRRRTSSCPPSPEPRPGYGLPAASYLSITNPSKGPEVSPQYCYQPTKRHRFFSFRCYKEKSSTREALMTTPLLQKGDGDSKWSVHYTSQKPQHGLSFIPGKRRSGSSDDLQACNELTQQSCSHPPSPSFSPFTGLDQSESRKHRRWRTQSRKMASGSSDEDERFFLNNPRPMTPLVLNQVGLTSGWDELASPNNSSFDAEMDPFHRLPTPEEKMRQQADAVTADIVPINVTGESFDRQASFRRALSNTDSLTRRPHQLSRRKTVSVIEDAVIPKPLVSVELPGQFSTVGRPASSCCTSSDQQMNSKVDDEEIEKIKKEGLLFTRRIRAPKGEGMSSLMASLTTSPHVNKHPISCHSSSSDIHSLPHLATNFSPSSEVSSVSASSSNSQLQDLQDFPNNFLPSLPFDTRTRVVPQSPSSSSAFCPSSPVNSSIPNMPSQFQPEWSPNNSPYNETSFSSHYLSSSSIADSVSQFSYQALDDQTASGQNAQSFCDCDSINEESWSYRPLSPNSSIYSGITQNTGGGSEESWNCDPLLSSGRSTPSCADNNSIYSEKIKSPLLKHEKRKSSTSSFYYGTINRSISLRKSKNPPPPPMRSDSLKRRTGCNKASCSSTSPWLDRSHVDRNTLYTSTSPPQAFYDPWVPRSNIRRWQSGLNCGTVTTFESLSLNSQTKTCTESLPSNNPLSPECHVLDSEAPSSKDEELELPLDQPTPDSSATGLQRLASPSSGYSSQSNTPTPGTPVSSPLNPSSPFTSSGAFLLPSTSPLLTSCSSSLLLSPAAFSLPRTRSHGGSRPKPPVPQRKSSLISSFSSLSSLSYPTSSDSLPRHPPNPPPPSLPLPQSSPPLSEFCLSTPNSSPPSPSLPQFTTPASGLCLFTPLSVISNPHPPLSPPPLPELPSSFLPTPPPAPPLPKIGLPAVLSFNKLPGPPPPLLSPLPTSSLPMPPILPPSVRPPPPPYSYAVSRRSHHTLDSTVPSALYPLVTSLPPSSSSDFTDKPDLPPPPPLPPSPPPLPFPSKPSTSFFSSSSPNMSPRSPCLLITDQALQCIKLRSVKNQKIPQSNGNPTEAKLHTQVSISGKDSNQSEDGQLNCTVLGEVIVDCLNTDSELSGPGEEHIDTVAGREESALLVNFQSPVSNEVKQQELDYYDKRESESENANESGDSNLQRLHGSSANQKEHGTQLNKEMPQTTQFNGQQREDSDMYLTLENVQVSSPESPWAKLGHDADKYQINTNFQTFSSEQPPKPFKTTERLKENKARLSESKKESEKDEKNKSQIQSPCVVDRVSTIVVQHNNKDLKSRSSGRLNSPEKPVPPKKSDLCVLGPKAKREPGRSKSPESSTGLNNQSQLSIDSLDTRFLTHLTKSKQLPKQLTSTCVLSALPERSFNSIHSLASSPQHQKPQILQKKPDLSLTSHKTPFASKTTASGLNGTTGTTSILQTQNTVRTSSTLETVCNTNKRNPEETCSTPQNLKICGAHDQSGTVGVDPSQVPETTSTSAEGTQAVAPDHNYFGIIESKLQDEKNTYHMRTMSSSLDEEEEEQERVKKRVKRTTVMMKTSPSKKDKAKKRHKRLGKQLLMIPPKMEPSSSMSSSTSSSSSSSENEQDVKIYRLERLRTMKVCDQETSDSEGCCSLIGESRFSLSSVLSTENLQGELSLPDLLIKEPDEEEEEQGKSEASRRVKELKETNRPSNDDVFVSISADQMFASGHPRTTEDLFAIIHRSKRKMLGRRDLDEEKLSVSSSSSPPETPTDHSSHLTRPAPFISHRSARSERFKALLLRKGSRVDPSSRISAVERLRVIQPPPPAANIQTSPPLPTPNQLKPGNPSCEAEHTSRPVHLSIDVPELPTSPCSLSMMFDWRRRDLMHNHLFLTSNSLYPFFVFTSSHVRPRSLTPPCSASHRFAARCSLISAPMTAIFEGEEEDEEVLVDAPGGSGNSSIRLV
ncbi:NHS-like protein 1 isoform X2 [Austrofundulus limnaeus]|uniref:NHS-like protein 1 isoform X2 n=1 Tax=Austrofundulus limnaeus TaxID=52670 RepID=A0A2I4CIG8_AUSLI|nr:PREDICTED: NHS-like protein 1 isoform X2 [Austrofundulus limnaeus]